MLNQSRFSPRFSAIVLLSAPREVLVERLTTRTSHAYGKHPGELAEALRYLDEVEPLLRSSATFEVLTTVPVAEAADAVLRQVLRSPIRRSGPSS
ncbi:hypothetical protein [Amycolatopsis benzoatilytica]|uniref:hypothetical protein n=1 Tax=Amycolatopsis benzoatilytica TaxID=346045 RepID=UPI001B7FBCBB|nr:hypothetical protein [Amycolatopsis benzoatilytica]